MKFTYKKSRRYGISQYIKYLLFLSMTKKSTSLFIRGGDVISTGPILGAEHESFFCDFLRYCSKTNGDYLLDIGANIGLISCQVGNNFNQLDLVEPNPIVQNILKSNLIMSFDKSKYKIHDFGLGTSDDRLTLKVPKHNFGGAFIKEGNSYNEKLLATKDGFEHIDENNYLETSVLIKNATVFFQDIFNSYIASNRFNGIIKIDVEGYEKPILDAIKKTLPSELNVIICFENHDTNFDLGGFLSNFDREIKVYKLTSGRFDNNNPIRNRIKHLLYGWVYSLVPIDNSSLVGDLVIDIK